MSYWLLVLMMLVAILAVTAVLANGGPDSAAPGNDRSHKEGSSDGDF